jgi:hypothetical protein
MGNNPSDTFEDLDESTYMELIRRHRLIHFAGSKGLDRLKEEKLRSLAISGELIRLHDKYPEMAKIWMVLKGPVLSEMLYGDVSQRQYNDLDIYVLPGDFSLAFNTLKQDGYKVIYPEIEEDKLYSYYLKYKGDVGLMNPQNRVYIELHSGIDSRLLMPRHSAYDFFNHLIDCKIAERNIPTPDPEYTFIYLSIHGARHLYFRLFWLKDLADFVQIKNLDHQRVLTLCNTYGLEKVIGLGLYLAKDLLGTTLPAEYHHLIEDVKPSRIVRICKKRIFGPEFENFSMKISRHIFFFLLKPGIKYKYLLIRNLLHRWYIRKFLGGH